MQDETPGSSNQARQRIFFAVGCAISLVAIWFATRGVDWAKFGEALRNFKIVWLIPAFAIFYLSMWLRGIRWSLLFRPEHRVTAYQGFSGLMIGFAFNSILPARIGEVVRCLAINKTAKTGVAKAIATVVAERILDGTTMIALLAIALSIVPIDPSVSQQWHGHTLDRAFVASAEHKVILFCIILIVGVILVLLPPIQRLILAIIGRMSFLPAALRTKIGGLFMEFSYGFHALKNPWTLVQIVAYSIVLWAMIGASNECLARGFDIPMGYWQGNALVTLVCFAIMIPAAPGYWGLYEIGVVFALLILGVEKDASRALAYGLMLHMLQWAPVVVWGLYYAWRLQLKPSAVKTVADLNPNS